MTKIRDKDLLKSFGERVKVLRLERNLSQYELAAICNIEQSQIKRIESGQINTTISTMKAIADAMKIELFQLVLTGNEYNIKNGFPPQ